MNILKILAVLTVLVPSIVFAHTDVTSTASNTSGSDQEEDSGRVDNGSLGGDVEVKSSEDGNSVSCTEEARVCPDGSSVGRVGPDCEFAECLGEDVEAVENETENESDSENSDDGVVDEESGLSDDTDNPSDGDVIDESGNSETENGDVANSFFDVFIDLSDEETKAAMDAFLKFDGIDGESVYIEADNYGNNSGTTSVNNDQNQILKEIVVDGSKVRKEVQDGKVQVRGWDGDKKEITISPEDILKGEDFLDFVGATVLSDANIKSVSLDLKKTSIKYDQPAKLLGFIPVNLEASVEFSGKDQVEIKFPWYTFFTKNNTKEVKDEIDALSLLWGATEDKGDTALQDRARKLQSINDVMKVAHDITAGDK